MSTDSPLTEPSRADDAAARVRYATVPPAGMRTAQPRPRPARSAPARSRGAAVRRRSGLPLRTVVSAGAVLAVGIVLVVHAAVGTGSGDPAAPSVPAAATLAVFLLAVWAWIATPLDDTLVAFLAAVALMACASLPVATFFASLGDETIWLLIGAFVLAAGVSDSGLALRGAVALVRRARRPRSLFRLVTLALTLTTFAVPATSGRAALAVPVFAALAAALAGRASTVRALSLLFPTVILLSAVGSLLGAGAHLITAQLLAASGDGGFTFLTWLWFGLPLAMLSAHLACEIVLLRFTTRADRRLPVRIDPDEIARSAGTPVRGPLTGGERKALLLLAAVVLLWCTEPWHGVPAALVALIGGLAAVTPAIGVTTLPSAVGRVPWSLLLFLAATLALGSALTGTGAAEWIGRVALAPLAATGEAAGIVFVLVVIAVSLAAHLIIPSRSARSAAIIPLVIAFAPGLGVEPGAAAFASTAAAGFCHTLPSSAKPVAMFADRRIAPGGFQPADLRRLSAVLAPAMFLLVVVFALGIWPLMGMPMLR